MKPIILDKGSSISKIFHLADIHIRLKGERHDEYNYVFDKLYEYLDAHKHDLIVICGDLLHSRLELDAESIQLTKSFIQNLAKFSDVIIIPGNHDVNINNHQRIDPLKSITDGINYLHNVYYLPQSGFYKYNNFIFGVTSVYDNTILELSQNHKKSNLKYVALWHGTINRSKTDHNLKSLSSNINLSKFKHYDAVLLGDIHKHQSFRSQTIAYSSSLIQQNFGEPYNFHGGLSWDFSLKKPKFTFIPIQNNFCFLQIDITNNIYTIPHLLSKFIRLKANLISSTLESYENLITDLSQNYTIIESTYTIINNNLDNSNDISQDLLDIKKISHPKSHLAFFKEYVNTLDFNNSTKSQLFKLHKKHLTTHNLTNYHSSNIQLLYLKFDNLFSYGSDNFIDFSNHSNITNIYGSNFSGKSSIINIVIYAIWGVSPTASNDYVVNQNASFCTSDITILVNNVKYCIKRKIDTNNHRKGYATIFKLIHNNGNIQHINLTTDNRTNTNKYIEYLLGSYKTFQQTCIISQNKLYDSFIHKKDCEKKNLLKDILNIEILDKISTDVISEHKLLQNKISNLKRDLNKLSPNLSLSDIKSLLSKHNTKIRNLQKLLTKQKDNYHATELKLFNLHASLNNSFDSVNIDDLQHHITTLKNTINELKPSYTTYIDNLKDLELSRDIIYKKIQAAESTDIQHKYSLFKQSKQTQIHNISQQIHLLNLHIQFSTYDHDFHTNLHTYQSELISDIDNITQQNQNTPNNNFNKILHILNKHNSYISSKIDQLTLIKNDNETNNLTINALETSLQSLQNSVFNDWEDYQSLLNDYNEINNNINILNKSNFEICTKYNDAVTQLKLSETNLTKYKHELLTYNTKINEIDKLKTKHLHTNQNILHNTNLLAEYIILKKQYMQKINNIKTINAEISLLHKLSEPLSIYKNILHKNGFTNWITSKIVTYMNTVSNNIISNITPFSINIKYAKSSLQIFKTYQNQSIPISSCSGFEQFIISIAIRLSLKQLHSTKNFTFCTIDEGFALLDKTYMSNMTYLFDYLRNNFNTVFIISHQPSIRALCDNTLHITRDHSTNNCSKILYNTSTTG